MPPSGDKETREFYDAIGWKEQEGRSVDAVLFHSNERGPIRGSLHDLHLGRIRDAVGERTKPIRLLECGCGGNPAVEVIEFCDAYVGVDFSKTGLALAGKKLEQVRKPARLTGTDLCNLPFQDASFDVVYSAHVIYHITRPESQEAALREMVRVLKPGGVAVVISANPRPLLWPLRLAKRLVADTPGIGRLADRLRPPPPLPYRPMTLEWVRRVAGGMGKVEIVSAGMASNWFNRRVREDRGLGRMLWSAIGWLERRHPHLAASLGSYVMITIRK